MSRPQLFKDTVLYAITGIATKMIGALLLPVLTRLLSVSDYGAIDLIMLGGLIALELALFGSDFTAVLYFHDETVNRRTLVGTLLASRIALGALLMLGLIIGAPWLAQWGFTSADPQIVRSIRLAALTLPMSGVIALWVMWLRQTGRSGTLLGVTLLRVAATAGLTILLVQRATNRLESYFWAVLLVDTALAIALTGGFYRTIGVPTMALARLLLSKGLAFLPRSIYFVVMALITRQILVHTGSLDAVGQYAAATKVSYILWIGISASSQAWFAYSLSIARQPEAPQLYSRYLSSYVSCAGFGVVGLAVFAADILRALTTPAYVVAAPTVGWQALSLLAVGSLVIVSTGLNIVKETAIIGRTTLVAGAINVALAFLLVPIFGILGAALAAALDQGITAVVLYRAAQRRYPLPFEGKTVLGWIGLTMLLVTLASALPTTQAVYLVGVKIAIVLGYGALLIRAGTVRYLRSIYRQRGGMITPQPQSRGE